MIKDFKNFRGNLLLNNVDIFSKVPDKDRVGILNQKETRKIIKTEVEKVKNIDEKIIELTLKSEITQVDPQAGFLIEVFLSGSDGRLTRIYKDDLVDLNGNVIEEGFSRYLVMDIDK